MGDRYVQVSLAEELRFFNVPLGMQLYASVLDLYGELNAIRWGLNTLQTRQQVIAKLVQKLHLVAEYLRAMGEPVAGASDEKLMQRYNVIIREMIPWKKLKNIPYAKVVSLREQLADDSITHEQRQGSYRSAYRLMWICIWYNLKRLVSRNGNQHTVPVPGDMPVAEVAIVPKGMNIPVAAVVEKEGEVLEAESALKKLKQQFGETVDVFDPIISGVGSDVDAIRSELLGTFKDTGDYSGVVNNANRMLGRIGSILPSFNGMMLQAYGHTDNLFGQMKDHSDRLLASMKGMMLYGYWLNRYTDTKIKGLQEMLSELLNSTLLQIGMKFPPVRKKLVRAMQHVSENDQGVLKQMRSAREKARLGWEGKLRADEIPSIPQAKVRL